MFPRPSPVVFVLDKSTSFKRTALEKKAAREIS
jgi:hypothetical protein